MESRFPAMLVLWFGREFYRVKYGVTGSSQAWTPDLGHHLGDKIWDLKGARIFSISLLGEEIRLNVLDFSIRDEEIYGARTEAMKKELERIEKEMQSGQEQMKNGQEEMKAGLEKRIEQGQAEMKKGKKEMKNQIQSHFESQVGEIKDHANSCIERIEDVQSEKREIGESRPTVKSLSFDGQTSWTAFKTQFDVVSHANGWNNSVKANQLVATLRGSAAEVLQGIRADKLADLKTIEKALQSRFGDSHLTQFYRTELKTRRQKPGEILQILAADVERLMSLAYAERPLDVRESLAVQFFVDAIRDEDTQLSTRLMDFTDLKSALAYSMKY
ncbi:hypothetical protein AVEN_237383-1 [Araneus ventricosus]|uniref:Uncharacterized protein n=1 Tax=Araneus ventricosus TaxID=182803 RepID=A0A4Y2JX65_ARAVE|nr:hypothetical protein AVEN_237383-1 [Araneus ventricosus]